jgi:5-methylcytosine-specific restriction endonuclease McrA
MIPIDFQQLRRVVSLAEINASNASIAQLPDAERKAFIAEHEAECSALRNPLWTVGLMKCWYSEASLQQPEGQVEHYRPKRRLSGARHAGYWWRAFDWTNLRLAHPTVNRRKTDYLTGKRAGKGSYFPLRDGSPRAQDLASENTEQPVLLDPIFRADTVLICFSDESGAPQPRYDKDKDKWLNQRAVESIDYYHLDEASWNARRADLMAVVRKLCEQIEDLACAEPQDQEAYQQKLDEIYSYIKPHAEFSSACRQIVVERGLLEQVFV